MTSGGEILELTRVQMSFRHQQDVSSVRLENMAKTGINYKYTQKLKIG